MPSADTAITDPDHQNTEPRLTQEGAILSKGVQQCIIITGLSGAGKTTALNILEDQGFYAIDNLPPSLLPQLMDVLAHNNAALRSGVAVVIDVRGEALLADLFSTIDLLKKTLSQVKLIFLEASDSWLVRRYETTRRRHPLAGEGITLLEGVGRERTSLGQIRSHSDLILDTSSLMPGDLRARLLMSLEMVNDPLSVIISSFGFKYGVPKDCDFMFDVRFLPNPNYIPGLQAFSGKDSEVKNYLEKFPERRIFLDRLVSLLELVLMQYENTVKKQVHIAVGCTGGRHRSVAVAEQLALYLSKAGHKLAIHHRDIDRDTGKEAGK